MDWNEVWNELNRLPVEWEMMENDDRTKIVYLRAKNVTSSNLRKDVSLEIEKEFDRRKENALTYPIEDIRQDVVKAVVEEVTRRVSTLFILDYRTRHGLVRLIKSSTTKVDEGLLYHTLSNLDKEVLLLTDDCFSFSDYNDDALVRTFISKMKKGDIVSAIRPFTTYNMIDTFDHVWNKVRVSDLNFLPRHAHLNESLSTTEQLMEMEHVIDKWDLVDFLEDNDELTNYVVDNQVLYFSE